MERVSDIDQDRSYCCDVTETTFVSLLLLLLLFYFLLNYCFSKFFSTLIKKEKVCFYFLHKNFVNFMDEKQILYKF